MSESGQDPVSWEALYRFRQEIDDRLESEQREGRDLPEAMRNLVAFFGERVGASAARVHLAKGDGEEILEFEHGTIPEFEGEPPEGFLREGWLDAAGGRRGFTAPFDIREQILGTATVYPPLDPPLPEEWVERYAEAFVEQLDNYVYSVHQARRLHRLAVRIQKCLETTIFEAGLDRAVHVMVENLPIRGFLLLYRSTHLLYPEQISYRGYDAAEKVLVDHMDQRDPKLEQAIEGRAIDEVEASDLAGRMRFEGLEPLVLPLDRHGQETEMLGKMFVWVEADAPRDASVAISEILQSCIVQRLADYSRETRNLQRYFSPRVVGRLLRTQGYDQRYLSPRVAEIGILFIDVAGFTMLSETILKEPAAIGSFVDKWSDETVRILLQHGGVMDKLIGDCVLGLFGPPFFEQKPLEIAAASVRCALEIRKVTQKMIDNPVVAPFREAILERRGGLDVSTGVNLAQAAVGTFGSNEDYTAFSSGMNNAARLQSLAKPGQTLIMGEMSDLLREHPEACVGFQFGEEGTAAVKNVAEPIRWVEVLEA